MTQTPAAPPPSVAPPADLPVPANVSRALPVVVGVLAVAALGWWFASIHFKPEARLPTKEFTLPGGANGIDLSGTFTAGPGKAGDQPGIWPGYRGPGATGVVVGGPALSTSFPESGPKALWSLKVGFGYASPAVKDGRVYLLDYDVEKKADALRCLSLADGAEIWRRSYQVMVKFNHGMSRTVPAIAGANVISFGPKCHVLCVDAVSGDYRWGIDLARTYETKDPPWYAGQCPLVDDGKVILAPAGKQVMMVAVDATTGKPVWTTPNTPGWTQSHSSVVVATLAGRKQYVYCASGGVVGVDAADGKLLWSTDAWKVSIATTPSPVVVGDDRLFIAGGYNAGCVLMKIGKDGDVFTPSIVWRKPAKDFGSDQHTPLFIDGLIYGVIPDGQLVCMDLDGKRRWASGTGNRFGIGPFLAAGGAIWVMNDSGTLTTAEITGDKYSQLARAKVLTGHDSWGPMTLVGTRLIVRDLDRMTCLDVGVGK